MEASFKIDIQQKKLLYFDPARLHGEQMLDVQLRRWNLHLGRLVSSSGKGTDAEAAWNWERCQERFEEDTCVPCFPVN